MEVKIYTPGHGVYTDTLIMYGIVSSLVERGVKNCVINGIAGSYEISIKDDITINDIAQIISENIDEYRSSILNLLINELHLIQSSSGNKLHKYLRDAVDPSFLANELATKYSSPGHAQNEGRYGKGQHIWLPLYPHIGKYLTREFRYVSKNYGVCSTCISLASLGFLKAVIPLYYLREKKLSSYVLLLSFDGIVELKNLEDYLAFPRSETFVKKIKNDFIVKKSLDVLPLITVTYMIIAGFSHRIIWNLYMSNAIWKAISVLFEISKGVAQIRGYSEIPIDRFLFSLVRLREIDDKKGFNIDPVNRIFELSKKLVYKEETVAVETLYRFLETRDINDLYKLSRSIIIALDSGLGKNLTHELAHLVKI